MKQHGKKNIRRIICVLLCLAMLPLVHVSASNYADAYAKLTGWAKQGEAHTLQDPEVGQWTSYYYYTESETESFAIQYQDVANPAYDDYLIIDLSKYNSKYSGSSVTLFLDPGPYGSAYIARYVSSDNTETGALDKYGNYAGSADCFLEYGCSSLNSGLDYYNCDTTVSETRFRNDLIRDLRELLEKADALLRGQSGGSSMSDIFWNLSPKAYHNVGSSWVSKAETCTVDGERSYRCASCGVVFTETIPAHHTWTLTREDVPATDEHGLGLFTCTGCGMTKTDVLCVGSAFTDMPAYDNWAHPGIDWAVYNGITNGTSATTFSPNQDCTRAQVVTFLWRTAGSPEPKSIKTPFTDVPSGAYYEKAVAWAVENGITAGTTKTTFSPNNTCTRGQIVTFLWRFEGKPEVSAAGSQFNDVVPGAYYAMAVAWAVENGVTNGTSRTAFSPEAKCTRAQVVTFLHRARGHALEPVEFKGLVGVSMPTKDLQRWNQDGKNISKQLQDAGYDVDLQFAANDPSMQISQLENMIANGAKALVVAAIDGDALGVVLNQAKQAGCAVIAYDRPIGSSAVSYYTTFDNFSVGAAQGKFIVDQLDLANAGGKVYNIELACGSPDDGNAYVFYEGAMSELRKYINAGTLKVVSGQVEFRDVATEGWSSERAQSRFEDLLSRYYTNKQLDAVMCSNDSTAQGVAAALANRYRNDVYPIITGQDCDIVSVRNVLDDRQAMTIFKDTRILVAKTVEMAVAIMKGSKPATNATFTTIDGRFTYPAFFCDPTVCTRENIRQIMIESGYYRADELS